MSCFAPQMLPLMEQQSDHVTLLWVSTSWPCDLAVPLGFVAALVRPWRLCATQGHCFFKQHPQGVLEDVIEPGSDCLLDET